MTPLLEAPTPASNKQEPTPTNSHPRQSTKRRVLLGFAAFFALIGIVVLAIAAPHFNEGTGDRTYHPTSFEAVEDHYEFGIGSLTVDLRDVDFPAGTYHISVDHGIGSARVYLPAYVAYDVTADLEAGEIDVFGETQDGFDNDISVDSATTGEATVIVDLEVDIGYGRIRQG